MAEHLTTAEASELIGLVYETALEKRQWRGLTERLRAMCPGHVVAVTTFDDSEWTSSHETTLPEGRHGDEIADVANAAETGKLDQPKDLHETMFSRQPLTLGALYSTRRLFSESEFRNFAAYKSTMAPIGAGHYAGIHFSITGQKRAAIMVVENDRDPTDKDHDRVCALLELISPHTVRAAQFARALSMARATSQTYAGFIDAIALPMLVISHTGQLQFANRLGQRILDSGQLLFARPDGEVRLAAESSQHVLTEACGASSEIAGPVPIHLRTHSDKLVLCVCPFRPALSEASGVDQILLANEMLFALFVGSPAEGDVNLQLLKDTFRFTHREAEVCAGILAGISPADLALRTGRAEKTVRNQIQAVYEKVGVKSGRELSDALAVFRTVGTIYPQ